MASRAWSAQIAYQNILSDDGNCSIYLFDISIMVLGCIVKLVEWRTRVREVGVKYGQAKKCMSGWKCGGYISAESI